MPLIKAAESLQGKPWSSHPSSSELGPKKSEKPISESESFGGMIGTLPSRDLSRTLTSPYE